jgi:hypothetical protein
MTYGRERRAWHMRDAAGAAASHSAELVRGTCPPQMNTP